MALPAALDFAKDPSASPARMNLATAHIDGRLRAVEARKADVEAMLLQLQQVGLQRVNDALQPYYRQLKAEIDAYTALIVAQTIVGGSYAQPDTRILLRLSSTSGETPPSLLPGEVGLNDADGALHWLDAAGTLRATTLLGLATTAYADGAAAAALAAAVAAAPVQSVAGRTGAVSLAVGDVAGAAALAGPTFTGSVKAPTPAAGDSSTLVATTAFVALAVAALVNSSPATLDTLKELADALGDDPNYAATTAAALALRLRVDAAQGLTAAQQAQGRANLGIAGRTVRGDADYTILATDRMVALRQNPTAPRTFTLPAASAFPPGVRLLVIDESGGCSATNTLTVVRSGTDTIGNSGVLANATSFVLSLPRSSVELESDGSQLWTVVSASPPSAAALAASLGFLPTLPKLAETSTSASDFSASGSNIQVLSVAFVATGARVKLSGAAAFANSSSGACNVSSYVDLYNTTGGALVGAGKSLSMSLAAGYAGSVSPIYGYSGLTIGATYTARMFVQRNVAVTPVSYTVDLVAENF